MNNLLIKNVMHLKTPDAYQVKLEEGIPPIRLYRNGVMISGETKGSKERRCNIDVDTGDLVSSDGKKVLAKGVIPKEYLKDIGELDSKDIKTAKSLARKLSVAYHPDMNPGDAKAEEMFKLLGGWESKEEKPEHFSSFNKGSTKEEPKKETPKKEEPKPDSNKKDVSVDVDPNNTDKKDSGKTNDVSVDVDTSGKTDNKNSGGETAVANPEDSKKTEVATAEDNTTENKDDTTSGKKDGESVESATGAEPDEEDNEDEETVGLPAPEDTTQAKPEGGKAAGTTDSSDSKQARLDPELSKQIEALVAKMSKSPNPDQAFFAEMDTLLHLLTSYVSGGVATGGVASGDKPKTETETKQE